MGLEGRHCFACRKSGSACKMKKRSEQQSEELSVKRKRYTDYLIAWLELSSAIKDSFGSIGPLRVSVTLKTARTPSCGRDPQSPIITEYRSSYQYEEFLLHLDVTLSSTVCPRPRRRGFRKGQQLALCQQLLQIQTVRATEEHWISF